MKKIIKLLLFSVITGIIIGVIYYALGINIESNMLRFLVMFGMALPINYCFIKLDKRISNKNTK